MSRIGFWGVDLFPVDHLFPRFQSLFVLLWPFRFALFEVARQKAVAQKAIGIIRSFGQKPVASARLATSFDFLDEGFQALTIQRAHGVRLSVELAAPALGLDEARGGEVRQFKFFRMQNLEENHIETRAAEKIDAFPELFVHIEKIAEYDQDASPFDAGKHLLETRAEVRLTFGASPSKRIKNPVKVCPRSRRRQMGVQGGIGERQSNLISFSNHQITKRRRQSGGMLELGWSCPDCAPKIHRPALVHYQIGQQVALRSEE